VTPLEDAVRLELLLPSEIIAALAKRSVVYIPLGTYEWHGEHLPIGLDALTAHGLCTRAALRDGGLVCPSLYYGTGGGHGAYPWTIMVKQGELAPLIARTLERLQDFGVETAILMSGHFAGDQIGMIEGLARDWRGGGNRMRIADLAVNMAPGLSLPPDHAARFETTLLSALWPDRVRIDLLPSLAAAPSLDPGGNEMGPQRHDPDHPLYGIFGPDPRRFDPGAAPALLDAMVDWLVSEVRAIDANAARADHQTL
jgi:creatinine amidohydrolase